MRESWRVLLWGHARTVEVPFERVEPVRPVSPIRGEPGVQLGKWLGAQAVDAPPGLGADIHEFGIAQHTQACG